MSVPLVAAIGSTDPWNAAGLGLDVAALAACGARAVCVVAGVTAQDARGVFASAAIAPSLVGAQFEALATAPLAAYRIGALLDAASVRAVAAQLRARPLPAVYDPVIAPSAGGEFAGPDVVAAMRAELFALVTVVTPNLAEAAALCGEPVRDVGAMERAARTLRATGARAVLVKGGHLADTAADRTAADGPAVDVLADEDGVVAFESPRLSGTMRGTGCLLACAIAAALARGVSLRGAVESGRAFVRERFEHATSLGTMRVAF